MEKYHSGGPRCLSGISSPDANAVDYSKMDTRLAGILDEAYRAPGQNVDAIKATMEFLKQIQGWPGPEPDRFYVYINVDAGAQWRSPRDTCR